MAALFFSCSIIPGRNPAGACPDGELAVCCDGRRLRQFSRSRSSARPLITKIGHMLQRAGSPTRSDQARSVSCFHHTSMIAAAFAFNQFAQGEPVE